MFKKNESVPGPVSGAPTLNMISEGTRLKGDLHSDNDIRISGHLEGEGVSKGKVIITSAGRVKGNVKASDADIAGQLEGELFITGKLILRGSAVIIGDIHTKTLLVEEGAQIRGNCKMSSDESELTGVNTAEGIHQETRAEAAQS
jgi:cytoskeletal protein CcmA (bactofilin family)